MEDLEENTRDRLVSAAKGALGACPVVGPMMAEVVGHIIPKQRLDRVVHFLEELDKRVGHCESSLEKFKVNTKTEEGLDILEEGIVQAARSASGNRQEWLAGIVGKSLSSESLKYEEAKKILNIFRELTDPELIWLVYISEPQTLSSAFHQGLKHRYPDVLLPVSRELGRSQAEAERGALQDGYKNTLLRLGLANFKRDGRTLEITPLGLLIVRYLSSVEEKEN